VIEKRNGERTPAQNTAGYYVNKPRHYLPRKELNVLLDSQQREKAVMLQADSNLPSNLAQLSANVFSANGRIAIGRCDHSSKHVDSRCFSRTIVLLKRNKRKDQDSSLAFPVNK